MIKKIQAETGAKVQFQQARDEGPGDRRCFLSGNPKQVEMVSKNLNISRLKSKFSIISSVISYQNINSALLV